ncbi:MAG: threonine--tRNA ligase [archaeon]
MVKFDFNTHNGKDIFRHSTSHILAQAILRLYPKALPTIGPPIEDGFYYDFDNLKISDKDLEKIEQEMYKIVKENHKFKKKDISKAEAKKMFKHNPYKIELIEDLPGKTVTIYTSGDFTDLCRGPHIDDTSVISAIKLKNLAGAYWRGDSKNKMLTRIYGISFPDKKMLKDYLHLQVEAERRDHRKLGKQLDLFSFHDAAPGMAFWHPKGTIIFNELIKYWREEHVKAGYHEVKTPIMLCKDLWVTSGHWDHYKENMYCSFIDDTEAAIKPMNCPGGMLIYKSNVHSYRELPLRMGEIGLVHRHEMSGVLHGLMRLRSFHQDDAHIFMTEDQIEDEIQGVMNLVDIFYKLFGLDYHIELSTRPEEGYIGSLKVWDTAETKLKNALKKSKKPFVINEGDGAFYGPKIDFHIKDSLGRTWQCATIQLDMALPERFKLTYESKDGKKKEPIMIHRVVYGAIERFLGILIEHYAGKLPLWISPIQVILTPITDKHVLHCHKLAKEMKEAGIRVEVDDRSESTSKKVRDAQVQKIPLIINIGDKEIENKTLAVRTLDGKVKFGVKVKDFIEKVEKNIAERKISISF